MCDSKEEDSLLSVEEAAEYVGVDLSQIYRIMQAGRVAVIQVEVKRKVPRISLDSLESYKKSRWQREGSKDSSEKGDH